MLPDISTPIMMTLAIIIGLLILILFIQVIHYVRLSKVEEKTLLSLKDLNSYLEPMNDNEITIRGKEISLEDLIRLDLEEQMTGYDPENHIDATNKEIQEVLKGTLKEEPK